MRRLHLADQTSIAFGSIRLILLILILILILIGGTSQGCKTVRRS